PRPALRRGLRRLGFPLPGPGRGTDRGGSGTAALVSRTKGAFAMRKPFFCLWIGFLLLLCCCSAPAPREPYAMEQTEAAAEPPETLSCPEMQALAAFFDSVSRSDEAFAAYLTENSLDLSGISSKQDVMDLIAQLDGVPFPTVADAGAADIAIYPSYGQFHVQYL